MKIGLFVKIMIISILFVSGLATSGFVFRDSNLETRGGYHIDEIRQMTNTQSSEMMRVHTLENGVITKEIPKCVTDFSSYFMSPLDTGTSIPIRQSGLPREESIVVVFFGDGFTESEQQRFVNVATTAANYLVNFYPFNLFKDLFTIYAIQAPSRESGMSIRYTPINFPWNRGEVDNRFGSYAPFMNTIRMPRWGRDQVRGLAEYHTNGNMDMIQVLVNSSRFGGAAYHLEHGLPTVNPLVTIAMTTIHHHQGGWRRTMIHEFAHSFGGLADEHNDMYPFETANMTAEQNDDNVRWRHWIGHGRGHTGSAIGIYRGGRHAPSGWAVPNSRGTCLMSTAPLSTLLGSNNSFSAVSSSELVRRMAQHHAGELFMNGTHSTFAHPTNFTIPFGTHRILPYAFNANTRLQNLDIPTSVTEIGQYAFIGATALRTITNHAALPQQINNRTFAGLNRSTIELRVPNGTAQLYRDAGWTNFNIIEMDSYVMQPGIYRMENNGTTLYLQGNDTSFKLDLYLFDPRHPADGLHREGFLKFQSNGDGTTSVFSILNGLNNLVWDISSIRISFYQSRFTIYAPGIINQSFTMPSNSTQMNLEVIETSSTNIINGRILDFLELPTYITTAQEFSAIRNTPDGHFRLANDIDLTNLGHYWNMIDYWSGILDGNGFTIYNLNLRIANTNFTSFQNFGLFRVLSGTVRDLTVSDINIYGPVQHNGSWVHVGAIAGLLDNGRIEHVTVRNGIITVHRQASAISGVVGWSRNSTIQNARVESVNLTGNGDMGGIVGYAERTTVSNSSNNHSIISLWISRNNRSAGGIVGVTRNNSTVTFSTVHNVIIRYTGSDNIAGRDIAPRMGLIVGVLDASNVIHVGQTGSSLDRGGLGIYRWGLFNSSSRDQARYIGEGGPWGSIGRRAGSVTILSEPITFYERGEYEYQMPTLCFAMIFSCDNDLISKF
ncbi:MAG: M64 family metallo-endopeptidase [Firmicutes bacterium]|nr:M64 family metallo-endopeptidase [Bacillota bacterium]